VGALGRSVARILADAGSRWERTVAREQGASPSPVRVGTHGGTGVRSLASPVQGESEEEIDMVRRRGFAV
jgi:hypothetical protein